MMLAAEAFRFFNPDHCAALLFIAVFGAILLLRTRGREPGSRQRILMRVGAIVLAANFLVWQAQLLARGRWSWQDSLPLHLCDAAQIAAILALWSPSRLRFELLYFWGLSGALQALLTPNITYGFPDYDYFQFFITHGGIVLAATFMAWGLGFTPRKGSVRRAFIATNLFAVLSAAGNLLSGGNYMFLCRPPVTGSLLDYFGPWPWYVLVAEVLALLLFLLLDLPFRLRERGAWPWPPRISSER